MNYDKKLSLIKEIFSVAKEVLELGKKYNMGGLQGIEKQKENAKKAWQFYNNFSKTFEAQPHMEDRFLNMIQEFNQKDLNTLIEMRNGWKKDPNLNKKKKDLDENVFSLRENILESSGVLEEGIKLFRDSKDARKKLEELKIKTYALNMKFSTEQKNLLKKAIKLLTKMIDELEDLEDKYLDTDDKEKKKAFKTEHKKLVAKYKEETKKALSVGRVKYVFKKTSSDELAVLVLLSAVFSGIGIPIAAILGTNIYHDKVVRPRLLKKAEKKEKELEDKESLSESILYLAGLIE